MSTDPDHDTLAGYLAPRIDAADVPGLYGLLKARGVLDAFATLFSGGSDMVVLRLHVLRELGLRAEAPRWSPQEIRNHFAYLDPTKQDTVLLRFRREGLLVWDSEDGLYQLSAVGRTALSALAVLLEFADTQDAGLGYLVAQVAAGQALGRVTPDTLRHLLGRLMEMKQEFQSAIVSGAESRIRGARERLESAYQWVEKGSEVIRELAREGNLEGTDYDIVGAVGHAQGELLRMEASFQRTINRIEAQRVHLGASGLNSSDVLTWLRGRNQEELIELVESALTAVPEPAFLTPMEMVDVAEYELLDRERARAEETPLPAPVDAPEIARPEQVRLIALERFMAVLNGIESSLPLAEVISGGEWRDAAYRMSLLSLLGDKETQGLSDQVGAFATIPLQVEIEPELEEVDRNGIARMSRGRIFPLVADPDA
jgi:hypothetical protein